MVKFRKTALGKTIITALWVIAAYVVSTGAAYVANYHWKASLVALGVPSIVNVLLFAVVKFADKSIPNFPTSTPVSIIPATPEIPISTPSV